MNMSLGQSFIKPGLILLSILAALLILEIGIRGYYAVQDYYHPAPPGPTENIPLHVVTDKPFLYGVNTAHSDISEQGTRDTEVAIPKPKGTFRVLVLGDSIAYGSFVPQSKTFANRLESLLREQYGAVEVVNAGVMGYTAYNELQYYLAKGRQFEADVVVVAFCMNDVVNPRLHWGDAPGVKIPDAAIPNVDYDRNHILPKLNAPVAGNRTSLLEHSELYKLLQPRIRWLFGSKAGIPADMPRSDYPKYITGEDTISIEVLLDRSSAEWKWLSGIYDQLNVAVRNDGAKLVIAAFPLAYQIEPEYPFLPQKQMLAFCEERSIPCLDLLPSFRQHPKEDLFLLDQEVFYDIWHLTEQGHERTAVELMHFLKDKNLLPKRSDHSAP